MLSSMSAVFSFTQNALCLQSSELSSRMGGAQPLLLLQRKYQAMVLSILLNQKRELVGEINRHTIFLEHFPSFTGDLSSCEDNLTALFQGVFEWNGRSLCFKEGQRVEISSKDEAACQDELGSFHEGEMHYQQALECYLKAYEIRKNILGTTHLEVAKSLKKLGEAYHSTGDFPNAIKCYTNANKIYVELLGSSHLDVARTLLDLGMVFCDQGDVKQAEGHYLSALHMYEEIQGKDHLDLVRVLYNLGFIYRTQKRHVDAILQYERALEICKKVKGENHPDVAECLNRMGRAYQSSGEDLLAIDCYFQAVGICLISSPPLVAAVLADLAFVYETMWSEDGNDWSKAIGCLTQALAIQSEFFGDRHPHVANILERLGRSYQNNFLAFILGTFPAELSMPILEADQVEALVKECYEKALQIYLTTYGERYPGVAGCLDSLAKFRVDWGRFDEAITYYQRALAIRRTYLPPGHARIIRNLIALATVHQDADDSETSVNYLAEAIGEATQAHGNTHSQSIRLNAMLNIALFAELPFSIF